MADDDQPSKGEKQDDADDDTVEIVSTESTETIFSISEQESKVRMVEDEENSSTKNEDAPPIDELNLPTTDNTGMVQMVVSPIIYKTMFDVYGIPDPVPGKPGAWVGQLRGSPAFPSSPSSAGANRDSLPHRC